jgi:hypothetical protein
LANLPCSLADGSPNKNAGRAGGLSPTAAHPVGHRLFRVTLLAGAAALLLGGLTLLALWAVVDFAPEEGRLFARAFGWLAIILVAAVVVHYPRSRRRCEANGCKYPD